MESRAEQAVEKYLKGYNCAQAVACTYCEDLGVDPVVMFKAMEGLGRGTASLVISVCRYVAVILPAAGLLSWAMGPEGVWHAFWITEAVTAAVAAWIYRRSLRGDLA